MPGTPISRYSDTGEVRHVHSGIAVRYVNEDRFEIHADDPNSARGRCSWKKTYRRGDWKAGIDSVVTVEALPDVWRVTARLEAHDADGVVMTRDWNEDIPRDHV